MGAHIDKTAANNVSNLTGDYIQLVALLTERGKDYEVGGAYLENKNGITDAEIDTRSGDILIYDGSTLHGVADIDPHLEFKPLDYQGRLVALATIYS